MPTPMNMKPRNAILGPITILLVEKISGLNWVGSAEAPPEVRAKPITIIRAAIAMRMKFFLPGEAANGLRAG